MCKLFFPASQLILQCPCCDLDTQRAGFMHTNVAQHSILMGLGGSFQMQSMQYCGHVSAAKYCPWDIASAHVLPALVSPYVVDRLLPPLSLLKKSLDLQLTSCSSEHSPRSLKVQSACRACPACCTVHLPSMHIGCPALGPNLYHQYPGLSSFASKVLGTVQLCCTVHLQGSRNGCHAWGSKLVPSVP